MRQARRAATERTTRGPETTATRGPRQQKRDPDAPELPSDMGHVALGVPLVLAACQASLGQEGARGASGFPPAPLAEAEANLAWTGDTREGAGRKEPRSEYCTVLGAGLSVSGGKEGPTWGLRGPRPRVHHGHSWSHQAAATGQAIEAQESPPASSVPHRQQGWPRVNSPEGPRGEPGLSPGPTASNYSSGSDR